MVSENRGYTMDDSTMKKEVNLAARAVVDELRIRSLPGVKLVEEGDLKIQPTPTRGYKVRLGSLGDSLPLELWLDYYLDRPEPFFWFGFGAESRAAIEELENAVPGPVET
jgi:hypothetical protein